MHLVALKKKKNTTIGSFCSPAERTCFFINQIKDALSLHSSATTSALTEALEVNVSGSLKVEFIWVLPYETYTTHLYYYTLYIFMNYTER